MENIVSIVAKALVTIRSIKNIEKYPILSVAGSVSETTVITTTNVKIRSQQTKFFHQIQ